VKSGVSISGPAESSAGPKALRGGARGTGGVRSHSQHWVLGIAPVRSGDDPGQRANLQLFYARRPPPVLNYLMKIRVVASVIEREGKLLLCERPPHKRHGGLWEFPGGKVEPDESGFEAVERELEEELAVQVREVGPVLFSINDPGSHFVIEFLPVEIEGEPRCLEHAALAWVTAEELLSLALAPSDLQFARFRARATAGEAVE
jgi:8-oxo-dGTP diphosphatase